MSVLMVHLAPEILKLNTADDTVRRMFMVVVFQNMRLRLHGLAHDARTVAYISGVACFALLS
jgi:hypothetical protein